MKYTLLIAPNAGLLASRVNDHLSKGWELWGAPSTTVFKYQDGGIEYEYIQAMILVTDRKPVKGA